MAINTKLKKSSLRGFTLIEMAISMTILAVAVGGGLQIAARNIAAERLEITNERIEYVMDAIEAYVNQYEYLPCPADGSLPLNDIGYGIGAGTNAGNGAGTCTSENLLYAGVLGTPFPLLTPNIVAGAIPIGDLGIDPIYMLDGWGRKILYITDEDLVNNAGFIGTDDGGIILNDLSGTSVINSSGTVSAAVMVISHGENGHGAWSLKGNPATRIDRGGSEGIYEESNAHVNGSFDDVFRLVPSRTTDDTSTIGVVDYFDDIIAYRLKWQL